MAHRYTRSFNDLPGVEVPLEPDGSVPNYQSYMIRITPESGMTRDQAMLSLREAGIATRPGITAIHRQPPYAAQADRSTLQETEQAVAEALILPLYPQMTEEEQDEVIQTLTSLMAGRS